MCTRELDPPFWQRNDRLFKIEDIWHTHSQTSSSRTRQNVIGLHVGECESASKITKKTKKKSTGKLKSHIKSGRRAACPMTPVSIFFFFPPFFYWFFFMPSTLEFVLFFFFLGIKKIKHWISDTSLDSWLSTKHRLKSNLILSLSLRWLESSIYNWAGLKLLCP